MLHGVGDFLNVVSVSPWFVTGQESGGTGGPRAQENRGWEVYRRGKGGVTSKIPKVAVAGICRNSKNLHSIL